MILELETLSKLTADARADVAHYCDRHGTPYLRILTADPQNQWDMKRVDGLITYLAAKEHPLKQIHTAAGVKQDYAYQVIKEYRARLDDLIAGITPLSVADLGDME